MLPFQSSEWCCERYAQDKRDTCKHAVFLTSRTTIWSEHLELIKFYLNQRADKNIKADEQRALSCKMELQNLNYTRLDPLIKK